MTWATSQYDYGSGTWVEAEEACYPNGGQTRRGRAIYPDGKLRAVRAGISDTFSTIPAHGRIHGKYVAGYLSIDTDSSVLTFHIVERTLEMGRT